jgi:hypothetical protein
VIIMFSTEITVGWEGITNAIIKSLSDTALGALDAGIKDGVKEVVKEGLSGMAKDAAGVGLQGASWGGLAPVAMALILGQLYAVQQQQTKLLKSIQRDVKALVEGPYNAGVTHLEDAQKKHRTFEERRSLIIKARDKFVEARGNQQNLDPFYRAIVEREIGLCWFLCGSWIDAKDWFERSFASANQALMDEKASFDKKDIALSGSAVVGGAAVGFAAGALTGGFGLLAIPAAAVAVKIAGDRNKDAYARKRVLIELFIDSISSILRHFNSNAYLIK